MFLFYLWCPWWRLSQILVPLSGLMGASRDSLRFFGGACVCEGGQVCQGKAPGANVGVTGSWLNWICHVNHLLCCWWEWGRPVRDELWALDEGQTLSVTQVDVCWILCEHSVVLSVKGSFMALAFHQRAAPTVDRKNGCGLSACSHLVSVMRGKSKSLLFSWNLGGVVAINYWK